MQQDKQRPTAPPPPPQAPGEPDNDSKRIKIIIAVAILLAGFGVMAYLLFDQRIDVRGGDGGSPTSFVPFIPIWIAMFIPFFAAKKKKILGNSKPTEDQKRIFGLIVAGSVLFVLFSAGLVFLTAAR